MVSASLYELKVGKADWLGTIQLASPPHVNEQIWFESHHEWFAIDDVVHVIQADGIDLRLIVSRLAVERYEWVK